MLSLTPYMDLYQNMNEVKHCLRTKRELRAETPYTQCSVFVTGFFQGCRDFL